MKQLLNFILVSIIIHGSVSITSAQNLPVRYRVNKKNGHCDSKTPRGKPYMTYDVKDGFIEGNFKKYFTNGRLEVETYFIRGLEQGELKWYWRNGRVKSIDTMDKGRFNGKNIQYWKNGNIRVSTNYINDKENGLRIEYRRNGTIKNKLRYKEDIPYDSLNYYNRKGKLIYQYEYLNGKRTGAFRDYAYYRNNKFKRIYYQKGLRNWTGEYLEFYKNGKIKFKGQYNKRKKDGQWIYYDNKGNLIKTVIYKSGEIMK